MRQVRENLSAREYEQYEHEKEIMLLQMNHQKEIERMKIQVMEIEAKWSQWLKLPLVLLKLPLYVLFGVAYCISMITKKDMPKEFWELLK